MLDVRPHGPLLAEVGHVVDRNGDVEEEQGLALGRHDAHRRASAQEPGDLVVRSHRGAEPDPAGGLIEQIVEALEREGEMGASLGAGDGVDLVDDDGVDVAQRLASR